MILISKACTSKKCEESVTTRAVQAASRLLKVGACVKPSESLLIISDTNVDPMIPLTIARVGMRLTDEVVTVSMKPIALPGGEPPPSIAAAMMNSDIVICATSTTLFHSNAKREACKNGTRLISMTGIIPSVFTSSAMFADFDKQKSITEKVAERFSLARHIRVTTDRGTDLGMDVVGRSGFAATGICRNPGDAVGFPDIEAYIAPIEKSVNGRFVVDGSTSVTGLANKCITLDIKDGKAQRITGGKAKKLFHTLKSTKSSKSFQVGEFGIGLNPLAQFRGAIIEDEGVLGTAHIALGDNHLFGGRNEASIHVDMVAREARVELDGTALLIRRRLLI